MTWPEVLSTLPAPVIRLADLHLRPEDPAPVGLKWRGALPIPQIGDRLIVRPHRVLGVGTVIGYFVRDDDLGVAVTLDRRPWHLIQHPERPYCLVFGDEIAIPATMDPITPR